MLTTLIWVLLVVWLVSLVFGAWGQPRYGYVGWSPAGLLIVLIILALLFGW
jgi:hypothetical protein